MSPVDSNDWTRMRKAGWETKSGGLPWFSRAGGLRMSEVDNVGAGCRMQVSYTWRLIFHFLLIAARRLLFC